MTDLRAIAEWVAEWVGYPVETTMPDKPPPPELWEAIVDHVHEDRTGKWHNNELSRAEVDAWLSDERGLTP